MEKTLYFENYHMEKTLYFENYDVDISSKSKHTFEIIIREWHPYDALVIEHKMCTCTGSLEELERWFSNEKNIEKIMNSEAKNFRFELVPY